MSVSSTDFLVSAQSSSQGPDEISLRNCVSRAYYSVYHAALPVADAHCPDNNAHVRMGDHERLSKRFRDSKLPHAKGIGYVLEAMKAARRRADYDIDVSVTTGDAQQALANASAFATHLANMNTAIQAAGASSAQSGNP
jgi:uncharacterized protein (UPF0332 family)